MRNVAKQGPDPTRGRQPESIKSWGFQGVNDAGLSVAVYREPDRLVIEIHAPMDLFNLDGFTGNAEPGHEESGQPPTVPAKHEGDQ
jgi:hypothetical protein